MVNVSRERVLELKRIIREDYGKELSNQEAYDVATGLVGYFDLLAKLDAKDRESGELPQDP